MKATSNVCITKEMLENMVMNITQINENNKYLLITNPQNNIKQEDLPDNIKLALLEYCPIAKGFLVKKKDLIPKDAELYPFDSGDCKLAYDEKDNTAYIDEDLDFLDLDD